MSYRTFGSVREKVDAHTVSKCEVMVASAIEKTDTNRCWIEYRIGLNLSSLNLFTVFCFKAFISPHSFVFNCARKCRTYVKNCGNLAILLRRLETTNNLILTKKQQ
jgi:hypothetical protein